MGVRIKVINPNPYEVTIKTGNTATGAPDGSRSIRAGKTEEMYLSTGKFLFYDKPTKNRHSPCLGEVSFEGQTFSVPPVPD